MEYNTKLYLLVLYIGFLAPFLLRGLTWAMLYVWTKNYPQVVGTCSGHHGQLISQNCVPTKIRAEPPPPPPPPPLKPSEITVHLSGSDFKPPAKYSGFAVCNEKSNILQRSSGS